MKLTILVTDDGNVFRAFCGWTRLPSPSGPGMWVDDDTNRPPAEVEVALNVIAEDVEQRP